MIKTITNLTIREWRDIETNEISAESLISDIYERMAKRD